MELCHEDIALPSPCTAFSQSLSVNSPRLDHVTRNALTARNNEASELGKVLLF